MTASRRATTRVTESSYRARISRSWTRKPSAIPESRSSASPSSVASGSSATFPEVSTIGRPIASRSRWWSGVYGRKTPRRGLPEATDGASAGVPSRREQHDRPGRAGEQRPLERAHANERAGGRQVPDHHGERLRPAPLAVPEPTDRVLVGGVAGEVIAPETFHRDDLAR